MKTFLCCTLFCFSIKHVTGHGDRCEKAASFILYVQMEFISLHIPHD